MWRLTAPLFGPRWRLPFFRLRSAPLNEAEALLAGRYLEYLIRQRQPIPAWVSVNAAAHGDAQALRKIASRVRTAQTHPGDPLSAEIVIADALLRSVGDDRDLLTITQAMLLVPLELSLMHAPRGQRPALRDVVETACALLGATPDARP